MAKPAPPKEGRPLCNVEHIEFESRANDIKAGLIDTFLNLQRIDTNLYLARHLLKGRHSYNAVYGGQVVGQSLAAAAATVEDEFIPHSLHSYFIKTGSVDKPILYMIDRIRDGRSFCTRIVKAVQDGEAIFSCQISFHKTEPDAIIHSTTMPNVPQPEDLLPARDAAKKVLEMDGLDNITINTITKALKEIPEAFDRVFDVRPAYPEKYLLKDEAEPSSSIWIRAREDLGDDHRLHQCVAAYLTDLSMLNTAMRPHVRKGFVASMSFSLDHCVWIHEQKFRVDEWMLYETVSSKARGSRAFIEGRLWTRDGRLVISTAQEALVRAPNGLKMLAVSMSHWFIITIFLALANFTQAANNRLLDCKPKEVFVENFIKYECLEENNVKELRVIGCVPTNDMTGEVLESWQTHDERWFKYHCVIDGDTATYAVKTCRDPVGQVLPVGKSRSFDDETFTCFLEDGKVKLNHKTSVGCSIGDKVYGDGASWTEKKEDKIVVGGEQKTVGHGVAYYCRKYSNGTFKVEFAACLTTENTYIRPEAFGKVDNEIVKCDIVNGECKLREAKITELRCKINNAIYRHDEEWSSSDGKTAYICQYGIVVKKGCLVSGTLIPLHSVKYVNGEAYYCYEETRLVSFGNIKGCKTANGDILEFEKTMRNGNRVEKCGFKFGENGAIEYTWTQVGCAYEKEQITINAIQQVGNEYVHCALNGTNAFVAKVMTRVEVEQWLNKVGKQWSHVLQGNEGTGHGVKREIPTTPAPTTKKTPTTTFAPVTTQKTKTTTPKPVLTTVKPITTPAPIKSSCNDLLHECEDLEIYCHDDEKHIEDLKEIIRKSSVNVKKRQKSLEYLNLITMSSHLDSKHEHKEDEQNCKDCRKCHHKEIERCRCEDQKAFSVKLVRSLCPKTCEACGEKHTSVAKILRKSTAEKCHKSECYKSEYNRHW
ncbi:unnamed protein product [Caenorhabditis bovis]|uniref:Acyl-CoA thioesterase II n=1 Tax=Caenorhabditis bovis TaxID=2654633 RepID=A0A8S1EM53_9PELO|nr:unnamed protein product [Caenorhabditis bovis]